MMFDSNEHSLDPTDWTAFKHQAHLMLDEMIDYLAQLRDYPVWQPMPAEKKQVFETTLPTESHDLNEAYCTFKESILPYSIGNAHPSFMGWVQGGGTPVGMVAELLAAGLNANVGGRNQAPLEVERQIVQWMAALFSFPETASGLFVTGTSMANLIGCLCARMAILGDDVRVHGLFNAPLLTAYTSTAAHISVAQAMDVAGLGSHSLRKMPVNDLHEINIEALENAIAEDKKQGKKPFLVVATAGTVDVGAIDDLEKIAHICQREKIWFHVDGAFGALAMFSAQLKSRLNGIEQADSIAFDFHKWGQVQYDAGFILVRDGDLHQRTFASPAAYLQRKERGMAANSPWACDFGLDLSRGFRALKTWFTLTVYGTDKLGRVIEHTCELAQYLKQRVEMSAQLELLAPVSLNIVCFRFKTEKNANQFNIELIITLQESGIAAPSSTTINGHVAIRAAIVNHRTTKQDIDALIEKILEIGNSLNV